MLADSALSLLLLAQSGDMKFWAYAGFVLLVAAFLALDLGVFHREAHEVSMREAAGWSAVWLSCGLAFAVFVYFAYERHWLGLGVNVPMYGPGEGASAIIMGEVGGADAARQYLTAYIVEKSLAMDNIFVIAMIFSFFTVPGKYQHRVLFWGIIGALIMRGGMIFVGAELVVRYTWVLIFFGLFLLLTALKMALVQGESDLSRNPVLKLVRRWIPVVTFYDGQRFITRKTSAADQPSGGPATSDARRAGWAATPLLLALVMVEVTDLIFAVDSIPAVFAITPDPFVVFTSNIFAILGLRSLYFCLAAMIAKFRYLKPALILILAFVGVKLLLLATPPYLKVMGAWVGLTLEERAPVKLDTTLSLGVVIGLLAGAIVLSVIRSRVPGVPGQQSVPAADPPARGRP